MKRSVLSLALLGLALPLLWLASPASAAPSVSALCAAISNSGSIVSQSSISIAGDFAAGEQLRFTATTPGTPLLTITRDGAPTSVQEGVSGDPLRYDVSSSGGYSFVLSSSQGPISLAVTCGVPPILHVVEFDGSTFYVNQQVNVSWACEEQSNPVASCTGGPYSQPVFMGAPLNTSHVGDFTFTVTGTDTNGLRSSRTLHYQVVKRPQSITMAEPPEHVFWGRPVYVTARSDSGLIVDLSVDPASTGCGDLYQSWSESHVIAQRPGTCTVHADQPGNDEWAPADRVTRTFVVDKRPSYLEAPRATKGLLNLFPTSFNAYLRVLDVSGSGDYARLYAGQQIAFAVGGRTICTGTTDANGKASCTGKIGFASTLNAHEYTASWTGDERWAATSATGVLK